MKPRAPRNRTITLTDAEVVQYRQRLRRLSGPAVVAGIENQTIHHNLLDILEWLPCGSVDLLFLDPPYNLTKAFHGAHFYQQSLSAYADWVESWFVPLLRLLTPTASVYVCGDWHSSAAIHQVLGKYLIVRSRITWEREKGRGAKGNWKNVSEDIWFGTVGESYTFNLDAVKLKRRVRAPYTDADGQPKDWGRSKSGKYRLTHPSNLWTDITVPFWSMPENTEHPTQKPEKLLAKLILASSNPGDLVLDPFLGSGTTSVVAKKLGRRYCGIEQDEWYCCLAEKRLALADESPGIQGYEDGVFWERNSR
jgi:site-specific DNA-methyltransferase (adenine-specific)